MSKIQVVFLQQHLGVFSFLIVWPESDMHGKQVTVRALRPEWYEARRLTTTDFAHYDRELFISNVLSEVGIVHNHGLQVSLDVVQAVWSHIQIHRANSTSPEAFVDSLTTGFKCPELNWVRSNIATLAIPVVTYIDEDFPHEFGPSVVAESLAARHRACSHI